MIRPALRVLAVACLLPTLAAAVEKEAPAEVLRKLDEQKLKAETVLHELENKEINVLHVLERTEQERRVAEESARVAHKKALAVGLLLRDARISENKVREYRIRLAHDLGPRLLLRYRLRGTSYLQMILSAPSIGDVLWRRRMIDRILASDFALVDRWAATQAKETAARAAVEQQQSELAAAEQAARDQEEEAAGRRAVQSSVLQGVIRQKTTWERTLGAIEQSRASLMKLIDSLPPSPAGLGGFGTQKGKLPWPIEGGSVEVKFGKQVDPRFHTVLQQKGYDFRAPEETPVTAPYAAVVGYAGWFSGFGNLVILDHGEGYYTLYAHLKDTAVAKGAHVDAGTVLGELGDSGSLKGPYLYFEIRSGSKALDPAQWLKKH